MRQTILAATLFAISTVSAQPVGQEAFIKQGKPPAGPTLSLPGFPHSMKHASPATTPAAADALIRAHDKNGDRRFNADECPTPFRISFATLDSNHDGYLDATELTSGLGLGEKRPIVRGKVIANYVYTVADDFVVDVYHNGEKVADSRREMLSETFGATDEKINIEVREGDCLVFNVVNNRLRWNGVSYFAVAGMKTGSGVGFLSDADSGQWSYCDDLGAVNTFIADPAYLANQKARPVTPKWDQGDSRMNSLADGWKGTSVWGNNRNTWIKYIAPPAPANFQIGVTH